MAATSLVTGATGFVGSALCRAIRAAGGELIGVGRNADAPNESFRQWISADVSMGPLVFPDGTSTVFHLAGKAHATSEMPGDDPDYARVNRQGTRHALDAAAKCGAETFVFFSSIKVFGDQQQLAERGLVEEDVPVPDTPYGRSKLEAERLVLADTRIPHRVVIRPTLVYGPGVKGNLRNMLVAVSRGRFPPLPETGNHRSLVHLDDLVAAAIRAAANPRASGRVYHVTDGEAYSTRRLYLAFRGASGRTPSKWTMPMPVLRAAGWAGDALGAATGRRAPFDSAAFRRLNDSAWFSSDRIREELDWKPLNTFESWCTSMGNP